MSIRYNLWTYWEEKTNRPPYIDLCFQTMLKNSSNCVMLNKDNINCYLSDLRRDIWDLKHKSGKYSNSVCMRADYLKVKILEKFGGVWMDADSVLAKSLDSLFSFISFYEFISRKTKKGWASVGFMGSIPHGEVISEYSKQLDKALDEKLEYKAASELGARMLTEIVKEKKGKTIDEYLNPIEFDEWGKWFSEKEPLEKYEKYIWFPLFNRVFPDEFKRSSREDLLKEENKTFFSRLVRKVLNETS